MKLVALSLSALISTPVIAEQAPTRAADKVVVNPSANPAPQAAVEPAQASTEAAAAACAVSAETPPPPPPPGSQPPPEKKKEPKDSGSCYVRMNKH